MKTFAFLILALASLSAWAAPVFRVPLQVDKDTSEIIGRTDFFEANRALLNDSVTNANFIDVTKAPFYAAGDGSTDDSDALQAAIDALGTHFKSLYLPAGRTFAISKPLVFETGLPDPDDYLALTIKGNFSTLLVTAPTSAIKLKAKSIFWGNIEDLVISYTTNYSDPNAVAISYEGTGLGGPVYNNIYNVSHKNITVLRGYYGFKQQEWCSVWGCSWENLFFSQEMTGGAMKLSTVSAFGNPNNRIENAYARADKMVQPVFELNQQDSTVLRNIEVNLASNVPCIYISASYNSRIESSRLEVGWYNQDYTGPIFTANNAHFKVDGYTIQSVVWGMPLWGFAVRDVAAPPFASEGGMYLDGILFRNNQKTEMNHVAVVASDYRRVQVGRIGFQVNDTNSLLTVPSSIPFASSASLSNVTGVAVSQSTNDIPRMRGLFTFDQLGNPFMSRGFSYVTDWHRLGEGDVFGAAGSTDRALVLWDGATGKRLNNSLITVDLDWNMTIPGQALNFGPGYGNPLLNIHGSPNGVRGLRFFSGYDMRWELVTSSLGETTNDNSGTDLEWRAYGISGTNQAAFLQTAMKLRRSDGRLVLRQPLEIGGLLYANAPNIAHWTNVSFSSPEGLETAPPGSIRLGMDGLVWRKASGEGNTGWTTNFGAATVSGGGTNTVLGSRAAGNVIADTGTDLISTNSIDGARIGTGTVADARIDSAIARDSEVTSAVSVGRTNFTAGQTIASFNAFQAHAPASNPAASATRNAIPVLEFDASTPQQARWLVQIPNGYTASTVTVLLRWTTTATSGNGRWGVRFWDVTGVDVDSDSFATASESTTACSGTAGTTVVTSIGSVNLDGTAGGEVAILEVYRDTGDGADTINSNTLQLMSVEVRAE